MQKRFSRYLLGAKLLFLGISISFLIHGFFTMELWEGSTPSTIHFVVDRHDPEMSQQIDVITNYLEVTTGKALSLATYSSGITHTLLPATTDYELYKVYLRTITPLPTDHYIPQKNMGDDIVQRSMTAPLSQTEFVYMLIFMLLALFL